MFGCHVPLISKQSLTSPSENRTITLAQPISTWQNYALHGNIQWVAKPGKYSAVFENSDGIFLKGETDSIEQRAADGRLILTEDGGIWVKSLDMKTARIFAFEGTRTFYSIDGNPTESEKGAIHKNTDIQIIGGDPSTNVIAGTISSVIVSSLTKLDPERIMFQSEEFDVSGKFNLK